MAGPVSKSDVRDRFSSQLNATAETGQLVAAALTGAGRRVNHKIDKGEPLAGADPSDAEMFMWNGDLTDLESLSLAFSRTEHTDDVIAAISDVDSPGVVGDLVVSAIQGDYLATQERAFRMRHTTGVRRRLHAAARRAGHGDERGLLKRGVLGSVESLLKKSKDV